MSFTKLRFVSFLALIFTAIVFYGQQTPARSVQRDSQSMTLMNQVVETSGGSTALTAIQKWKATGTVTYFRDGKAVTGQATLQGMGSRKLRLDVNSSTGVESSVSNNGVSWRKGFDGRRRTLRQQRDENLICIVLPAIQLAKALLDPTVGIVDGGSETKEGRQLRRIELQPHLNNSKQPGISSSWNKATFFVDPSSFQVVGFREMISPEARFDPNIPHEIWFSNFQKVDGILVPFTVDEKVMGQPTFSMTLEQVQTKADIDESVFSEQ